MGKIIKDALILAAFSLVLGLALGSVYSITKPVIEYNAQQKEMEAYKVVFEDSDSFAMVEFDANEAATTMAQVGYDYVAIKNVIEAKDASGNKIGYVISVETSGYSTGLAMSIGVRLDGTVNGFSVTAHGETPGFGKNVIESDFGEQFKGVKADKFENGVNVDYVAGATITSAALTDAVNATVKYVQSLSGNLVVEEEKTPEEIVFENAAELKEIEVNTETATALMTDGGYDDEITGVSEAYGEDGSLLGYVVEVTAHDGYHGDIIMIVGIQLDGTVNGYAPIEHEETRNIGTKAFEEAFSSQFAGVNTDKFVPGDNVDLIANATVSSSAVMNAVNAAIDYFNSLVGGAQ